MASFICVVSFVDGRSGAELDERVPQPAISANTAFGVEGHLKAHGALVAAAGFLRPAGRKPVLFGIGFSR